jgi:N-(2-amino-2-carboxyethyl)-L-glutamate synthase
LYTRIEELSKSIGSTGFVQFPIIRESLRHEVYIKAEWQNPTGSMKDRTALALVERLYETGRLGSASRVIESSSGNLALSLAHVCTEIGIELVVVTDPLLSPAKRARLALYPGVELDEVHEPDQFGSYLAARQQRVSERMASDTRLVWTDQYRSQANPVAHYRGTGSEIIDHFSERLPDAVFVPVSTGGTYSGIRRRFFDEQASTEVVAVDTVGSVAFGGQPGPRFFTGIGSSQRSNFSEPRLPTHCKLSWVGEAEVVAVSRELSLIFGFKLAPSTLATIVAAIRYLDGRSESASVVCIGPDDGKDYLSTLYEDQWLSSRGLLPPSKPLDGSENFPDLFLNTGGCVNATS